MVDKSAGLFLSCLTLGNFRWNTLPKSGLPIVCSVVNTQVVFCGA